MAYSAKCTGDKSGGYYLNYGKGSKKILSHLDHEPILGWVASFKGAKVCSAKLKRDAVADWEKWAASEYGGTGLESHKETSAPSDESNADAPTDTLGVNDELSEYDRSLLTRILAINGPMTEWQRSSLRNLLKRLTSAFEPERVNAPAKSSKPPKFVVNNEPSPEIPSPDAESDTGACSPDVRPEIQDIGEESGLDGAGSDGGTMGESEVAS